MKIRNILLAVIAITAVQPMEAKVTLPYLIGDGMVVQRNTPVKLWGWAEPGEKVNVVLGTRGKAYTVTASDDGSWFMETEELKPGGPYEIRVNDITIKNVLCGDVFLCSGQSNMELPVSRVMDMFSEEVNSYENKEIRQFLVPQVTSFHGTLDNTAPSQWKSCTQGNVREFSAIAYFFAKGLYSETGIPVGIINSSWGGTPVEAWTSEPTMQRWPQAVSQKRMYEDDGYRERLKKVEGENFYRWNMQLDKGDPGLEEEVKWIASDYPDTDWEEVDLIGDSWGLDKERGQWAPVNGSHWLRRHVPLTTAQAAGEALLRMGCIEGADSAFVNGVFVGTVGYQYPPRIYKVPGGTLHEGDNVVTVRVISQGGEPKAVPEKPYMLITSAGDTVSLEGKWKHRIGSRMPKGPDMIFWHYTPIVLYDAMIAPLFNFPVAGIVWYQGESNVGNRDQYFDMLSAMIADWRKGYGREDIPFYIVELADFLHPDDKGGRQAWAEMRVQQARVADADVHATLIKNSDCGEWNDIHPLDKKTPGQRIARKVLEQLSVKN